MPLAPSMLSLLSYVPVPVCLSSSGCVCLSFCIVLGLYLVSHFSFLFLHLLTACLFPGHHGHWKDGHPAADHKGPGESCPPLTPPSFGLGFRAGMTLCPTNSLRALAPGLFSWDCVHPELGEYRPDTGVFLPQGTGWLRSALSYPGGSQETPVGTWEVVA